MNQHSEEEIPCVNIRPGVGILSVLQHLNYQPWFALAEFVDNSLQSYLQNQGDLTGSEGDGFVLRVDIVCDPLVQSHATCFAIGSSRSHP